VAPGPAKDIFTSAIQNLQKSQGAAGILFFVGLGGALWSASGYVAAFMRASNAIYDVEEGRPIWKTLPTRVLTTVVLLLMLAAVAVAVALTGPLADQVGKVLGIGSAATTAWDIAKWPVILVVVITMFAILGAVRVLRRELRLLQQDLRRAGRRDHLPDVALDLEHRDSVRSRVQRGARARAADRGRLPGGRGALPRAARHAQDEELTGGGGMAKSQRRLPALIGGAGRRKQRDQSGVKGWIRRVATRSRGGGRKTRGVERLKVGRVAGKVPPRTARRGGAAAAVLGGAGVAATVRRRRFQRANEPPPAPPEGEEVGTTAGPEGAGTDRETEGEG
jgi:hypothetical protein